MQESFEHGQMLQESSASAFGGDGFLCWRFAGCDLRPVTRHPIQRFNMDVGICSISPVEKWKD